MLQRNHIRMEEFLHDLQFTVLVPLVLVHFLDGYFFVGLIDDGLEDDTE